MSSSADLRYSLCQDDPRDGRDQRQM